MLRVYPPVGSGIVSNLTKPHWRSHQENVIYWSLWIGSLDLALGTLLRARTGIAAVLAIAPLVLVEVLAFNKGAPAP